MKTAVIVQARMGSTRLPGKVLKSVAGRTILAWTLERCLAIPGADAVCCATVETADCDPVADAAAALGVEVFRGDEKNVLSRYLQAARMIGADVILRVTSDCPVIDARVADAVLELRARSGADYACNNMPSSWPHGLDCEAFTMDALERAARLADTEAEAEHVTAGLRTRPQFTTASLTGPGGIWEKLRWTLDTPGDMAFFEALLPRLDSPHADLVAIAERLIEDPALLQQCLEPGNGLRAPETAQQTVDAAALFGPLPDLTTQAQAG